MEGGKTSDAAGNIGTEMDVPAWGEGEKTNRSLDKECRNIYETNPGLCVLVNKDKELDPDFDSDLRSICGGRLEASAWMYDDLTEMLRAAGDAGYDYWIASGNANMDASQAGEPANRWLLSHCSEYGFILRYPRDKVSVTGIAWEPWHFRYVGKEAAKYMAEQGLTLEEFCGAAARG